MGNKTWVSIGVALAAAVSFGAQAQQAYDLRALNVAVGFVPGPPTNPLITFDDRFNNGNPLAGGTYTGSIIGTGTYSTLANGLPLSAELSGPDTDFFGVTYGVGRMRFRLADATPNPSNLDPLGTATRSSRLILNNPTTTSLLNFGQSFEVSTFWNYTIPDSGSFYGIRVSDNPGSGAAFNDLIDLRVVRGSSGQAAVNLRRLTSDGSQLTGSALFSQNVSAGLFAGHALAEVRLIELRLHYNALGASNPKVLRPAFRLVDGGGNDIGLLEFAALGQLPTIFNGETWTSMQATANWTLAVPEPGTWVLMAAGLTTLLLRQRRRV